MSTFLTFHGRYYKTANVAFILGAGASYDHGYPLISEFLSEKYLIWLCDQCAGLGKESVGLGIESGKLVPDYPKPGEMLDYALSQAKSLRRISVNFEEVLSITFDESPESYERAVNYANWLLSASWSATHTANLMTTVEYLGLGKMLLDLCDAGNSCVITFNYDTAVEDGVSAYSRILRRHYGIRASSLFFNYGFRKRVYNVFSKHFINLSATVLPDQYPKGLVPILKLHGSMNMKICPKCSALHYGPWEGGSGHWSPLSICKKCRNRSLNFLMVPPGKRKVLPDLFTDLWKTAHAKLVNSDLVVISGYSMPAYDADARSLLKATLPGKYVLLVDPSPNSDAIKFLQEEAKAKLFVSQKTNSVFIRDEINYFLPHLIFKFSDLCQPWYMFPERMKGHSRR